MPKSSKTQSNPDLQNNEDSTSHFAPRTSNVSYRIDPKAPISELILEFPEIAEVLTYDYGLHCVNCMISDFDTLEEGALIHGIEGEEFNEMIQDLEETIQGILDNKSD